MKSNVNHKIFILITLAITFTLSPIVMNNLNFTIGFYEKAHFDDINIDNKNLKTSKISEKIHIDYNWSATKAAGICTGSGTFSNPYVIEDLVIDANGSGSCILIENTDVYFRIENCTLVNSGAQSDFDAGITIIQANNGKLINNILETNNGGIVIRESININISSNEISNNYLGIMLSGADINYISDNDINNNDYTGITLRDSEYNGISNNIANNNGYGLYTINSQGNTISGNVLNDNTESGILLKNSNNNTIIRNSANNNFIAGIFLTNSSNNLIVNNSETINNNRRYGIYLKFSNSNNITNNVIKSNGIDGIYLLDSDFNNITENSLFYNKNKGINEVNCENNLINSNIIKYSKRFPLELLILISFIIAMIIGVAFAGIVYKKKMDKLKKQTLRASAIKAKKGKRVEEFNVFLSYSTKDTELFNISKIVKQLELYPEIKNVYFWEADSGEDVVKFMEQTLKKVNVFILFCSENSLKSKAVEGEWHAAYQLRKRDLIKIIPVYEKEDDIPYLLMPLLNVKFTKHKFDDFIQTLYEEILR